MPVDGGAQSETPVVEPRPPSRFSGAFQTGLRVAGGVIAVVAALVTALAELVIAPLRVGGHLIGVAVIATVVANLALGWFAATTVGRKWAVALPAAAWLVLMVTASGRTSEGDLLLVGPEGGAMVDGDSWVGVLMILAGSVAFAVVGFRLMLAQPPLPGRASPPPASSGKQPPPHSGNRQLPPSKPRV
ncbi:hypothetical protein [Phytohabitans maris]|uniref:hypothetical protein n=1 Tax=Phytohabitans maris TaxID=3071409 RepID=UPI003D167559